MSLIQLEKTKQVHKASDILIHATEKQCSFVRRDEINGKKEYCVMGLLGLYATGDPHCSNYNIEEKFNMSLDEKINCPECDLVGGRVSVLVHLNNTSNTFGHNHNWTFKQIGEWLQKEGY